MWWILGQTWSFFFPLNVYLFIFCCCSSTDHPASGASVVCNVLFWCCHLMSSGWRCSSQQLWPRSVRINEQKQLFHQRESVMFFFPVLVEKTDEFCSCLCWCCSQVITAEQVPVFFFCFFFNDFLCFRKLFRVVFFNLNFDVDHFGLHDPTNERISDSNLFEDGCVGLFFLLSSCYLLPALSQGQVVKYVGKSL